MSSSERELRRAVKIAAAVMEAAGLCRHEDVTKCQRMMVDEMSCRGCIERWLMAKARRELRREAGQT